MDQSPLNTQPKQPSTKQSIQSWNEQPIKRAIKPHSYQISLQANPKDYMPTIQPHNNYHQTNHKAHRTKQARHIPRNQLKNYQINHQFVQPTVRPRQQPPWVKQPTKQFDNNPNNQFDNLPINQFDEQPISQFDKQPSSQFDNPPINQFDNQLINHFDNQPTIKERSFLFNFIWKE